ncbi:lipid-A-disaccharide synthase N-terminal domain-containing protein [Deferribacter thermophilus]|uniref:lipid-A-disaccharide synthase N-terminal domain-containing protein n=1 Tax=Deferribacter thermophilus TaxID=53573 RepID=UPI003C18BD54
MSKTEIIMLTIGFTGQFLFFMRFFVQWIYSEKMRKSVIPIAFWYFSLGGSICLLTYAILRKDIVFIVGQSTGFLIYIRNLYFIHKEKKKKMLENDK